MLRYILKRLLQGVFVLIGVSIVIFCLSRIIPGDPARLALGQHATQEAVDNLSKQMYLDKPLPVQYILWFRDVLHGDFGISLSTRRSVTEAGSSCFMSSVTERRVDREIPKSP